MTRAFTRTKSIDRLLDDAKATGEHTLKRTLGPVSLISLGIGGIIGAGLFVRTAAAIADRSGPAVIIAFIVAGVGCAFADWGASSGVRTVSTGMGERRRTASATEPIRSRRKPVRPCVPMTMTS